jgi:hypothetical protein
MLYSAFSNLFRNTKIVLTAGVVEMFWIVFVRRRFQILVSYWVDATLFYYSTLETNSGVGILKNVNIPILQILNY